VLDDQPSVAAGARLPIEGTLNFRDLGGYPTTDGRVMRTGRVYRSDHLNTVTDDGFAALRSLELRTVVDLRRPDERERQPSRLPGGTRVVLGHADAADAAAPIDFMTEVRAGRVATVTDEWVTEVYIGMLTDAGSMFATVIEAAADADQAPMLFHCTAGKDRTGLCAAILQRLCGVSDGDVVADFLLTDTYRTRQRMEELGRELAPLGIDVEGIRPMIEAPLPAFLAALAWLDDHGGTEAYVVAAWGVTPATVARLRAHLVS
jgi:protein-tyrosine phosphatase